MEFTTCSCELMPEKALTSFTIYVAYRYFAGQTYRVVQKTDTQFYF